MDRLITLLTDFGADSPYVAQMCGVLHSRVESLRIVHITHSIPPQDIHLGAIVLEDCLPWFPVNTIHIAVVDPGVGTTRRILAGRLGTSWAVLPDNGLVTRAAVRYGFSEVVELEQTGFWIRPTSNTFHGRDIMAPIAAAMLNGTPLVELGKPVVDWIRLQFSSASFKSDRWSAEVVNVDGFGNVITNLSRFQLQRQQIHSIVIAGQSIAGVVSAYGEAESGSLIALIGSSDRLEVAVVNGNAAERLSVGQGTELQVIIKPHTIEP